MDKRKRFTVLLVCALIMSLSITSALAVSTSINYDAKGTVTSAPGTLGNTQKLSGTVASKKTSTDEYGKMTGYLDTKGNVVKVNRDKASVAAGKTADLSWNNPNGESGTFSVSIISPGGHDGTCSATASKKQ